MALRHPSRPGGRVPRRHSASRAWSGVHAVQHVVQHPVADRPLLERVDVDGHGVLDPVDLPRQRVVERAEEPLHRIPEEARRGRRAPRPSGGGAGSGPEMNGGCSARSPARARAAFSTVESNVNGSLGISSPGMTLRVSKGCNGCLTTIVSRTLCSRRQVEGVEQFGQRHRGRPLLAGVFVGAGVGDDELLGRGADRVEQQLPVLGTDVAFAGHRVAGQHVVAVDHTEPREHAVVEPDQADHPVRHRAHRHHRAHRQRAGAEVGPGRPSREVAVQERADVGQAHHRVVPRARRWSARRANSRCSWLVCQASSSSTRASRSMPSLQCGQPLAQRSCAGE